MKSQLFLSSLFIFHASASLSMGSPTKEEHPLDKMSFSFLLNSAAHIHDTTREDAVIPPPPKRMRIAESAASRHESISSRILPSYAHLMEMIAAPTEMELCTDTKNTSGVNQSQAPVSSKKKKYKRPTRMEVQQKVNQYLQDHSIDPQNLRKQFPNVPFRTKSILINDAVRLIAYLRKEGVSRPAIAEILGISLGTVASGTQDLEAWFILPPSAK